MSDWISLMNGPAAARWSGPASFFKSATLMANC